MLKLILSIPWHVLILGSLLLGLAPFTPQPHLFEKIGMLLAGTLARPIDIFDLLMHAAFPLLLLLKTAATLSERANSGRTPPDSP